MADKAATKAKVQRVQRGLGVADDGAYGPITRTALLEQFRGPMSEAISFAENNKRNHGVLSVPVKSPEHAKQIGRESIENNLDRFMAGKPSSENWDNSTTPRFVDFMRERWAPYDADNPAVHVTPKENELNPNWAPNVRKYLQQKYPEQYQKWRDMRLTQTPMEQFQVA